MTTKRSTSASSERTRSTTKSTRRPSEVRAFPIRDDRDHAQALARIEQLMRARAGTPEGDELEVLTILVSAYEDTHHPIDPPDPVDALKFRLEQGELTRKDLEHALGSRARVSEVLSRRRPMSLAMIRRLFSEFGIPLASLVGVNSSN